jgi:hypothetical protein
VFLPHPRTCGRGWVHRELLYFLNDEEVGDSERYFFAQATRVTPAPESEHHSPRVMKLDMHAMGLGIRALWCSPKENSDSDARATLSRAAHYRPHSHKDELGAGIERYFFAQATRVTPAPESEHHSPRVMKLDIYVFLPHPRTCGRGWVHRELLYFLNDEEVGDRGGTTASTGTSSSRSRSCPSSAPVSSGTFSPKRLE